MPEREPDPYANFRFKLELGAIQVAGFTECTGLSMETKVFELKEGGNNHTTLKFPEHTTYGNVTLKRGATASHELLSWQLDVANGTFRTNARSGSPNISIVLFNEKGTEVKRWKLIRALPVKWVAGDLKASGNEVMIESLELTHEGIEKG